MIRNVNHVSITVKDLDKVVAFFRDILGLTNVGPEYSYRGKTADMLTGLAEAHFKVVEIETEGFALEFVQYLSPPGSELKADINDMGSPHIGFEVDNIEEMYSTLCQKGVEFKSAPVTLMDEKNPSEGWKVAYFWGPEHMILELVERLKTIE